MNDSGALESLVITGESRRALDVTGGIRSTQLEVEEQTLLNEVDIRKSINVGADVNICGELRCDKLFHYDDFASNEQQKNKTLIWRANHLPDTHSCNTRRYDLGSERRRWENTWVRNIHGHRADIGHVVGNTARIEAIEATSLVVNTIQSSTCIHSYSTVRVNHGDSIELTSQITLLQLAETSSIPCQPTVDIHPVGECGCKLEIVALDTIMVHLPNGLAETIQKGYSLKLLNVDGIWICYR